jgi:8-oxo-dGTP diphosphatase / 2-hydroxy-dATP diphosphatase
MLGPPALLPHAAVFHVPNFSGEPRESEEMAPGWWEPAALPYDEMWADDRFWYPLYLRGQCFRGLFAFEQTHNLVWHELQVQAPLMGASINELLADAGCESLETDK